MTRKKTKIECIENFGDINKLAYNEKTNRMEAVGRISPTDTARLLLKIAEHYATAKTTRGKRIYELASDLAKLIKTDCDFFADTLMLAALGKTICLDTERKEIVIENDY